MPIEFIKAAVVSGLKPLPVQDSHVSPLIDLILALVQSILLPLSDCESFDEVSDGLEPLLPVTVPSSLHHVDLTGLSSCYLHFISSPFTFCHQALFPVWATFVVKSVFTY